jgi:hypothetical protein
MADGSWLYFEQRGACRLWPLERGLILALCRGVQFTNLAPHVIAEGERALQRYGRCVYLVDAYDSTRMDTAFRETMTAWFKVNRERATVHMLLQSKLLEMAVNVARLTLGRNTAVAHSNPEDWEHFGRSELPSFKRRRWETPPELRELFSGF